MSEGAKWLERTLPVDSAPGLDRLGRVGDQATYFCTQLPRLSRRRGAKRAAMAVAHSQLGVAYQTLKRGTTFADLGRDHFDRHNAERQERQLIEKMRRLGCEVPVEATAT